MGLSMAEEAKEMLNLMAGDTGPVEALRLQSRASREEARQIRSVAG